MKVVVNVLLTNIGVCGPDVIFGLGDIGTRESQTHLSPSPQYNVRRATPALVKSTFTGTMFEMDIGWPKRHSGQ